MQLELGVICKVNNEEESQELFFTTSFAKKTLSPLFFIWGEF